MDELTEAVNLALDRVKAEHNLSETELVEFLGVSDRAAIYRWRRGRLSKAFRTVARITNMFTIPVPLGWAEQAVDIRILAPLLKMPDIAS